MEVYRFVSAEDTVYKQAYLSKRERSLLEKSKIARELKNFVFKLPEEYWLHPKPIPVHITKIVKELKF